ncbi:Myocilin, partial [Pseudolycoriella hygida]
LNITRIRDDDYGEYQCISRNDVNTTTAVIYVNDCVLYAVGKPVYHKFTDQTYGSWLKDPLPRNDDVGERIWSTNESDTLHIYEYANKAKYRNNIPRIHKLKPPGFRGNAHVVYNGSFYYQEKYSDRIVRYDLDYSKQIEARSLYKAASSGSNFLYTTEYNYMDFSVDDNGLWVIYTTADSNNTHVAKLDPHSLIPQYSWNISINHHKVGEMFIVCGVLYAVDSVVDKNTKIRLALDLYRNQLLDDVNLSFTNPFKRTTTVGYNYRSKELYTWDKGNQLTYPTRYHEVGNNASSSDKTDDLSPQMHSGIDIYHDNGYD